MKIVTLNLASGYASFRTSQGNMESESVISTPSDGLISGSQKPRPLHG